MNCTNFLILLCMCTFHNFTDMPPQLTITFPNKGIPSPKPIPFFGNVWDGTSSAQ